MNDPTERDPPLAVSYDAATDVLMIDGHRYAGAVFRGIGWKTRPSEWIQIVERRDGLIMIRGTGHPAKYCPECGARRDSPDPGGRIFHEPGCLFDSVAAAA